MSNFNDFYDTGASFLKCLKLEYKLCKRIIKKIKKEYDICKNSFEEYKKHKELYGELEPDNIYFNDFVEKCKNFGDFIKETKNENSNYEEYFDELTKKYFEQAEKYHSRLKIVTKSIEISESFIHRRPLKTQPVSANSLFGAMLMERDIKNDEKLFIKQNVEEQKVEIQEVEE